VTASVVVLAGVGVAAAAAVSPEVWMSHAGPGLSGAPALPCLAVDYSLQSNPGPLACEKEIHG